MTITPTGTFDGAAAWEVRTRLDALPPTQEVVFDFHGVRDFYDFGLAVLAHGLSGRPPSAAPVRLRNLKTHQLRLFRYFWIETTETT